jgi:hypothetical protein
MGLRPEGISLAAGEKNPINPACRVEAFSKDWRAEAKRSEDW